MFTLTGTVESIGDVQQITDRFKKRDLVLFIPNESKPEYPNRVAFQATNNRIDSLNSVAPGQQVEIKFFINGKKVNTRRGEMVINNLDISEIKTLSQPQGASTQQPQQQGYQQQPPQQNNANNAPVPPQEDDLPF